MADLSPNLINLFDKKLQVVVSSDKLQVKIKIAKFKWPLIKSNEIITYLETKKIIFGVNKDAIKKAIVDRDKEYLVGEGLAPIRGIDGHCNMVYRTPSSPLSPRLMPGGEVDHRELDAIICVLTDEVLYQIFPATEGVPGKNIYGEISLPEKSKQDCIQPGENTYLNPEDQTIRAKIGGLPYVESGVVMVKDTITINQDIDYSIGNIRVPCNLIVIGSIQEGFTVSTGGYLKVKNEVNNAFIQCGGNMTVGKGIINNNGGKISVEGDLQCKYLNKADIWVNGNLIVFREILFSNIVCAKDISCTQEEGVIIGGNIRLEQNLVVNEIGTKLEAANTRITICDMDEYLKKIDDIEKEKAQEDESLIKLIKELKGIQEYIQSTTITQNEYTEFEGIYSRYLEQANQLKQKINQLLASKEDLKNIIKDKKSGEIQIKQTIYPGVRIKIKDATLLTKYEEKRITYYYNTKKRALDTRLI